MDADLTFNSIVFKKAYDTKEESLRQSTARGINTPDRLIIRSQEYVDSQTKVSGTRYTARVDRVTIDANGKEINTSCYLVFAVPGSAVTGDVTAVTATFKAAVADADLIADVLNNEK